MQNKISIILCSYNEVKYIENTINQLEKHIPNLELVIVDDSSNDGTIELLKKLNTNNRFKLIFRKKSKGLASAFSRGLIETTGEYIGWIDTNMGETSVKFTAMISELNNNSDVVILSNILEHIKERTSFLRMIVKKSEAKTFLIRVPLFERDWQLALRKELGIYYFSDLDHEIEHTTSEFKKEVNEANLKIKEIYTIWGEIWANCSNEK